MRLIHPVVMVIKPHNYDTFLRLTSFATGLCYGKSHPEKMTMSQMERYIKARLDAGHESVIEHCYASVCFTTNRGITHEIVRHRLASYTQSSTRYIDICNPHHDGHCTYILPFWAETLRGGIYTEPLPFPQNGTKQEQADSIWFNQMLSDERAYKQLRGLDWTPEQARGVLPNDFAANLIISANMREWRYILGLRAEGKTGRPHPQMRQIMYVAWWELHKYFSVFIPKPDIDECELYGTNLVERRNWQYE